MIPWASAALLQEAYASSDTHIVCDAFGSQPQPRFSMHITVLSCVEQHCVHSISPALLCTKDLSFGCAGQCRNQKHTAYADHAQDHSEKGPG